jgi:hypothetical protein
MSLIPARSIQLSVFSFQLYVSSVFPRRDDGLLRTICCAVVALLVSSEALFAQTRIFALRPAAARHRSRVILAHRFGQCPPVFIPYTIAVPLPVPITVSYPIWDLNTSANISSANYVFAGSASPSRPQLVFNDGTTYSVTDYWRVDDQLHFITVEEGGTKSVPHTGPFADLDVQRTTDRNSAQGFRFVIRDQPIEQWLEQHRAQPHPHKS